jgi:uncharacterized protein YndB with AHSA1/START domain
MPSIIWPDAYHPRCAQVFVANEIVIPAPPPLVWAWLIRARSWPAWYSHAANVEFEGSGGPDLSPRARFRWKTRGLSFLSTVREFEPQQRIAWDTVGTGIHAYHAWVLEPRPDGFTYLLTAETQTGWLARLGKLLMPTRAHRAHQVWLEALSTKAQSGLPVGMEGTL